MRTEGVETTGQGSDVRPAWGTFDRAPFLVFWETTRACDLVCRHCRAEAVPHRSARELSTEEGFTLLAEIHAMGTPVVVLTGGDPAKRPDLIDLVRHGASLGLRMALTPSATPLLTEGLLERLQAAGLARLALSLDGADAETHDGFRGVAGSFDRTLRLLRAARRIGLTTQVNTSVLRSNEEQLERVAALLEPLDIELWAVFLVVPTGRAAMGEVLGATASEDLLERLAVLSERVSFDVKTTAAPHFRRILLQRKVARREIRGLADGIGRAPRSVNEGQGVCFVSHVGDVYPSGFLPIRCGNVRDRGGLSRIYREHPLMRKLRDADALGGKCGRCEFRKVCGGSRARAYAVHGDPLAEEPACVHEPGSFRRARRR